MKLIRSIILLIVVLALISFFSLNQQLLDLKIPLTDIQISIQFFVFSSAIILIGFVFGFFARKTSKRDYIIEQKRLKRDIEHLEKRNKIYEAELKVLNQLQKSKLQ